MRLLLIDNNDSFTYNLAQQLLRLGAEVTVVNVDSLDTRNEWGSWDFSEVEKTQGVVISPGPKSPKDYPVYTELLKRYHREKPILGVCLGHQILGDYFGAPTVRAPQVMHGKTSLIQHTGKSIFEGISTPMNVARYHSLVVSAVPEGFEALAWTADAILMAMRHKTLPLFGVQFHPESFLTEEGDRLILNFLKLCNEANPS
jgi:anthranilate synthase/aminodeoxychorismate synthase-like glutamine amidotransferase